VGGKRTDFLEAMARMRERIRAARVRSLAVQADAAATVERMRRARAQRAGVQYVPNDPPNFVPESHSQFQH
jgi:hypothetical protein